jgi:hypothetical protein
MTTDHLKGKLRREDIIPPSVRGQQFSKENGIGDKKKSLLTSHMESQESWRYFFK